MESMNTPYADGVERFVGECNEIMSGDYHKLPVAEQRNLYETLARHFNEGFPENVESTEYEFENDGVRRRFRVYKNKKQRQSNAFVFYVRGGGFVLGSLETHHVLIADICDATGLDIVAADFRLAPEARFPAAIDDCQDVLRYVLANSAELGLGVERVLICGDSSGGNMAVAVCMRLRDLGEHIIHAQVLFNPVLDFSRWRNGGSDAPLLTSGEMEFYTACYAPGDSVFHEHVSPLRTANFAGLPPAYVMAADLDSLRTDSEDYVLSLLKNGIRAELTVEAGLVHGAVRARNMSAAARKAFERTCGKLAEFASS